MRELLDGSSDSHFQDFASAPSLVVRKLNSPLNTTATPTNTNTTTTATTTATAPTATATATPPAKQQPFSHSSSQSPSDSTSRSPSPPSSRPLLPLPSSLPPRLSSEYPFPSTLQSPKKPRAWSLFRRSASSLAAAFSTDRLPPKPKPISSQNDFRTTFLRLNRHRIIRDVEGNCFRLHTVVMNGDCGFSSIAKGINFARATNPPPIPTTTSSSRRTALRQRPRPFDSLSRFWRRSKNSQQPYKRALYPKDIRSAMYHEVRKAKKTYLSDRHTFGALFSDHDFDRLEREVGTPGLSGHWLGTVLGVLEHVIVAHAMNVDIFLYQFDLQRQCIRRFESATVTNPDHDVYLFFTGPAASGHFDVLIKIHDPNEAVFSA